jgi:endo-1,4-beta-xylanase
VYPADSIQTTVPALKDVYAHDFTIGCLLSYRNIGFPTDSSVSSQSAVITPNGGYLIKYHMNCMSPGNNMKPQNTVDLDSSAKAYNAASLGAARDSVETHPVVKFNGDMIAQLNWAKRQGFTFRGHTLVWHNQTPTAFFRSGYSATGAFLTKSVMTQRMDFYIHEIIRLIREGWPGLLSAIDVVNEAIDDNTGKIRTSSNDWYTTFGDSSYVMKAFELARKYTIYYHETQIKLYYNDYNTHLVTKANGIVGLITPIFQAGYLDGIGMQEHDSYTSPTAADWITTYNKFYQICTEMAVTEFEVTTTTSPTASTYVTQANQYGQLFKCFVERSYKSGRGKIINVSKDGLNDQYTQGSATYSSLWDASNQCKPAFYAVANVGINYHALDSLISYANTLKQAGYTTPSWSNFSAALTSAKTAIGQNYSASMSADTALGTARDNLKAGINGLVNVMAVHSVSENNPKTFALGQNYPNPFNPTTQIKYSVPQNCYISLKVYNLLGEEVATLFSGMQQAGNYVATVDGTRLASGIYFYRMQATTNGVNNFQETKKLILMK